MNLGLSSTDIKEINRVFSRYKEVEKVVLYGSRAKGNYRKGSDIDLVLFGFTLNVSVLYRIEDELDDLLLPYAIDISLYDLIDNENLIDHIKRVGVVFYKK